MLRMILKREGNILNSSESQFKSILEILVRATFEHPELLFEISLRIVELFRACATDGHPEKIAQLCGALVSKPRILDLLNLNRSLRDIVNLLEQFCNGWALQENATAVPPTLSSSSASAFLLLSQAVFQFDIGPQAAKEVFLDQDGFCAKSFRRSHGGLSDPGDLWTQDDAAFYLESLFQRSPPALKPDPQRLSPSFRTDFVVLIVLPTS